MIHRFLNAAKANSRFSRIRLKPTARKPNLKLRMDGFKGGISDTLARMTPEELHKQIFDLLDLTDDDIKAFTPFPDENDPGIFESEPHPDDDVTTHVQVGDSQCLLTGHLKRRLEHISGFPRPVKETGDKAYRISTTLNRGMGMFASCRFKTGDLVADERPLMVYPIDPPTDLSFLASTRVDEYLQDVVGSIFEYMSDESQDTFMGLRNRHLHDGCGPLLGVARTNGYVLDDDLTDGTRDTYFIPTSNNENMQGKFGRYTSVYKDLSRVNHSCSPNTYRKFHMATFSMQLRAARDIERSEEIFTTFTTDILQPAAERAEDLVSYGIECTCRACLDPTKSDPIRAAVRRGSKYALYTSYAEIDAAVQTLARIEQEELHASAAYRQTLHELFSAYLYLHDEKTALMYGEKLWLARLAAG
ncbi:uncharacterized protein ARMOST_11932 [Armillaria ostoyae]|uniref:SET domain-containing protein n=1 Tax=Armillaria ostoyae TaxID=47428 RepID=A0A284RIH6_ARMOS|nr:uncharacterized protein ARMOST_11932 [Armillaria ostoyae]